MRMDVDNVVAGEGSVWRKRRNRRERKEISIYIFLRFARGTILWKIPDNIRYFIARRCVLLLVLLLWYAKRGDKGGRRREDRATKR